MTERICYCGMPHCMDCFEEHMKFCDRMGGFDGKDLAYEGMAIAHANAVDDEVDDQLREDQYPNGDGWQMNYQDIILDIEDFVEDIDYEFDEDLFRYYESSKNKECLENDYFTLLEYYRPSMVDNFVEQDLKPEDYNTGNEWK